MAQCDRSSVMPRLAVACVVAAGAQRAMFVGCSRGPRRQAPVSRCIGQRRRLPTFAQGLKAQEVPVCQARTGNADPVQRCGPGFLLEKPWRRAGASGSVRAIPGPFQQRSPHGKLLLTRRRRRRCRRAGQGEPQPSRPATATCRRMPLAVWPTSNALKRCSCKLAAGGRACCAPK